jgi:hypothetical protein
MDRTQSAFVSTRSKAGLEDALICDGWATYTLTEPLERCTHVRPKVMDIQKAHGATSMSTFHLCLKTYYIRASDHLVEIRLIVLRANVVPGLKHALQSVKELKQSGHRVIHDEDIKESRVFAIINKRLTNPNNLHL